MGQHHCPLDEIAHLRLVHISVYAGQPVPEFLQGTHTIQQFFCRIDQIIHRGLGNRLFCYGIRRRAYILIPLGEFRLSRRQFFLRLGRRPYFKILFLQIVVVLVVEFRKFDPLFSQGFIPFGQSRSLGQSTSTSQAPSSSMTA